MRVSLLVVRRHGLETMGKVKKKVGRVFPRMQPFVAATIEDRGYRVAKGMSTSLGTKPDRAKTEKLSFKPTHTEALFIST